MGAPGTTPGNWLVTDRIKGGYYKVGSSHGLIAIIGNGFNIGSSANDAHQIAASGALFDALEALCAGDIDVSGTAIILGDGARTKIINGMRALAQARGEGSIHTLGEG